MTKSERIRWDLLSRTKPGIAAYTVLWPGIVWLFGFYQREPQLIPAIVASYLYSEQWQLSALMLFYWLYLGVMNIRYREEYRQSFDNETELQDKQKELEFLNRTDALTQVYNRRCFDEALEKEWHHIQRAPSPLSLLFIDIDHFKSVNDTYGHLVGDQCLRQIAGIISSIAQRHNDTVARYGGEEFAVLLPTTNIAGAQLLAERIRQKVSETPLDDIDVNVTVSIGVSTYLPDKILSCSQLVDQADKALYKAKEMGRNCTTIAPLVESTD